MSDSVAWTLPGSSVRGTLQARVLERVTLPSSRGSSDPGIEPESAAAPLLQAGSFSLSYWEAPCIHAWAFFWCSDPGKPLRCFLSEVGGSRGGGLEPGLGVEWPV